MRGKMKEYPEDALTLGQETEIMLISLKGKQFCWKALCSLLKDPPLELSVHF
jgi:hypothetical protein